MKKLITGSMVFIALLLVASMAGAAPVPVPLEIGLNTGHFFDYEGFFTGPNGTGTQLTIPQAYADFSAGKAVYNAGVLTLSDIALNSVGIPYYNGGSSSFLTLTGVYSNQISSISYNASTNVYTLTSYVNSISPATLTMYANTDKVLGAPGAFQNQPNVALAMAAAANGQKVVVLDLVAGQIAGDPTDGETGNFSGPPQNNGIAYSAYDVDTTGTNGSLLYASALNNLGIGLIGGDVDVSANSSFFVPIFGSHPHNFGLSPFFVQSSDPVQFNVTGIPEPGTFLLLGSGLIGLALFGGRRFFNK